MRLDAEDLPRLLFAFNEPKTQEHGIYASRKEGLVPNGLRIGQSTVGGFDWGVAASRHITISAVLVPKVSLIFLLTPINVMGGAF
jgi:hypothetical protein